MATGLADYLGVDVVVVRIAFVVLAFVPFPGFGVLVYLAMLLLVPEADSYPSAGASSSQPRSAGFWVGVGLIGVATFALVGVTSDGWAGGQLLPLLLIGLGVALWVDADRRNSARSDATARPPTGTPVWGAPPSPGETTYTPAGGTTPAWRDLARPGGATASGGEPAPVWAAAPTSATSAPSSASAPSGAVAGPASMPYADTQPIGTYPPGPPAPPVVPPEGPGPAWEPPATTRERSPLGRITLGLALLAGGVAWLLDVTDVVDLPVAMILALVVGVLGLGLLVGAVFGRARWLAIVVAVLIPVTVVAAAVEDMGIDVRGGVDSRVITVTSPDQVDEPVAIGAGDLTVDLGGFDEPGDTPIELSIGAGEMTVLVPEGAGLTGEARVEVGELEVFGGRSGGIGIERSIDVSAEAGGPTYVLDLRVGAGTIEIDRVPVPVFDDAPTGDPRDGDPSEEALDLAEVQS